MAQWSSPNSSLNIEDTDAVIFNLTNFQKYKSQSGKNAIFCRRDKGPCFGDTQMGFDLGAETTPLNLNCISKSRESPYLIQEDSDGRNLLTNLIDKNNFTISELEVWEVIRE